MQSNGFFMTRTSFLSVESSPKVHHEKILRFVNKFTNRRVQKHNKLIINCLCSRPLKRLLSTVIQ